MVQAPCYDGLDWSGVSAARLELSLQQLFSLLGGDPDAYSACVSAYASELARRIAGQPRQTSGQLQAGAAEAGQPRADERPPSEAKKPPLRLGGRAQPGGRDRSAVNDGVEMDAEPGVARLLGIVGSYAGLGLVLRAMLAQEAESKPAGGSWVRGVGDGVRAGTSTCQ